MAAGGTRARAPWMEKCRSESLVSPSRSMLAAPQKSSRPECSMQVQPTSRSPAVGHSMQGQPHKRECHIGIAATLHAHSCRVARPTWRSQEPARSPAAGYARDGCGATGAKRRGALTAAGTAAAFCPFIGGRAGHLRPASASSKVPHWPRWPSGGIRGQGPLVVIGALLPLRPRFVLEPGRPAHPAIEAFEGGPAAGGRRP